MLQGHVFISSRPFNPKQCRMMQCIFETKTPCNSFHNTIIRDTEVGHEEVEDTVNNSDYEFEKVTEVYSINF